MDDAVVGGAQPGQVGEIGAAAVFPMVDLVSVDPLSRGLAVGEPAPLVAHQEGVAPRGRGQADGSAVADRQASPPQSDPQPGPPISHRATSMRSIASSPMSGSSRRVTSHAYLVAKAAITASG